MSSPAKCRSCGADIFFIRTPNGRQTPVNAQLVEGDVVWIQQEDKTWKLDKGLGYVSHFATCPHAQKHRKSR